MTERLSHKRDCLYKDKITCLKSHLFVLEKADYTYNDTVIRQAGQPTHLPVICSIPSSYKKNYKEKVGSGNHFHNVLCLSEAKGMDIMMKNCKIVSCGKKTAVMALAVSVGAMLMTGCSTSASASGSTASAGKPVVTVWAGGSDNVRVQFEKQIQQFNASQDQYTAELQFITSGTGAQGLFERVVAGKRRARRIRITM